MSRDRLQLQRFELKYFIPERITGAIRDFTSAYLELDENCVGRPNLSYAIHSLYLDSDGLATYWETVRGSKNRYKLRMRYYDERPDSPVHLEIKRRVGDAIRKQRCAVRREAARVLLNGQLPERHQILSEDPKHVTALHRFLELMYSIRAHGKVHVAYLREAWISPSDDAVRLTIDRDVRASVELTPRLTMEMDRPENVFDPLVVLELKFTNRFPKWFGNLVQTFDLERRSAAKYADGVAVLGEHRFQDAPVSRWARVEPERLPPGTSSSMLENPA